MSPLPQAQSSPQTQTFVRRYYSDSTDSSTLGIALGIVLPFVGLFIIIAIISNKNEKEKKRRQLEETIHRQIHLHPAVCQPSTAGNGSGGVVPDHVLREITREVQRELERVRPAATARVSVNVNGTGTTTVRRTETDGSEGSGEGREPLPPYEPRRDTAQQAC